LNINSYDKKNIVTKFKEIEAYLQVVEFSTRW